MYKIYCCRISSYTHPNKAIEIYMKKYMQLMNYMQDHLPTKILKHPFGS